MRIRVYPVLAVFVALLSACGKQEAEKSVVESTALGKTVITVYSARKEHLIKPLFDLYTAENSNVEIQYITDSAGPLLTRLEAEGKTTPADILMTVDAGNLWQASQRGVLQVTDSTILDANIPAHLRASDNTWFGLSKRARTIVYSTERVAPEELSTYEALAEDKWQGRLCLRTSKKVYNQSLVATMISALGEARAEAVVNGWVANLAVAPFSNDTKAMEAVLAGQCDVTVVNTYYYGRLKHKNPDAALAIFWPNQSDRGVHVNVSGAGITKYAKQPAAALKLLEWLSGADAQRQFASLNQEFPVNQAIQPSAEVASWGAFKADQIKVEEAGRLQAQAIRLMDRAGYH